MAMTFAYTMIEFVLRFFRETVFLFNEMAIYLLLGLFLGGLIHAFLPENRIKSAIGKPGMWASLKAALLGIPLPLCSCGVVPTALSIRQSGATRGATVSFLISTPQTGVDSIAATWSMLGPVFAIFRPVVAFITGTIGGFITDLGPYVPPQSRRTFEDKMDRPAGFPGRMGVALRYGFHNLLGDIARWIVIGILIGGLISALLPPDFFQQTVGSPILTYALILLASVPIYVCATGSIPVVLALIMKGLTPGAAFVFLMAGPATNAASLTILWKTLGRRTTLTFLITIIAGALGGGIVFDLFFRDAFLSSYQHLHESKGWFSVVKIAGSVLLLLLMIRLRFAKSNHPKEAADTSDAGSFDLTMQVDGMTCGHCKMNVERAVSTVPGVEGAEADIDRRELRIRGTASRDDVQEAVEEAGYSIR